MSTGFSCIAPCLETTASPATMIASFIVSPTVLAFALGKSARQALRNLLSYCALVDPARAHLLAEPEEI